MNRNDAPEMRDCGQRMLAGVRSRRYKPLQLTVARRTTSPPRRPGKSKLGLARLAWEAELLG